MSKTTWNSKYFFGHEVSRYGQENGYIDYRTLSQAFDMVLNNQIIASTGWEFWEQENGLVDNSYEIEQLTDEWEYMENHEMVGASDEELVELEERIEEIKEELEELEENNGDCEIYQYFIISERGADILKDYTNEYVFYNSDLDMHVWGVTHWGTSWDYVLTNIKLELDKQETA